MISVIIPTYKNKTLLLAGLKNNLVYLKECEVIVVNDSPGETIHHDLKRFPIILCENKENLGFGGSINEGVKKAKGNFIMLLNTDVILHDKSYINALSHFDENKNLFAVSFVQKEKDGKFVGKNTFYWKRGLFFHQKASDLTFGRNGWAEGGACIIDKKKFLELTGFDPLYKPFYWEDIDLSYRAWKRGWEVFFDPSIVVEHHHESTIGKYFDKSYIKSISFRNQFIFIWKNINSPALIFSHLVLLPWNLVYYMLKGELSVLKGFFNAFLNLGKILAKRKIQKKLVTQSEHRILDQFTKQ